MSLFRHGEHFEASDDPRTVVSARSVLWKWTHFWYDEIAPGLSSKDEYWLPGVDHRTGQRVQIHPRGTIFAWVSDLVIEAAARRVQALALPFTVPVLHVGPGIVFADPLPARPRPSLSIEAAATCALRACEVAARLHARGVGRLGFGPSHLRLLEENGDWQIRWLVPGVPDLDLFEALELTGDRAKEVEHPRWRYDFDPIQHDLWQLSFFFFSLLAPEVQRGGGVGPGGREAIGTLVRIRDEGPEAVGIHDAASMAGLFAKIAPLPATSGEALPVVRVLPRLYPDWDDVVADGEVLLKNEPHNPDHIRLPLAAAYHQRASRAWARGDLCAALEDAERAITHDNHAPYQTTRAVLLDALNRRTEAGEAISGVCEILEAQRKPRLPWQEDEPDDPAELARALLTRGIFALRDRRLDEAEADLRRAAELHPTPLSTRALCALARARDARRHERA